MNRTLFSLAIIRTNWELFRKDYIENFVPLFASLIKQRNYSEISIEKLDVIREDFKNEYGLFIPSNPTITILNRLSKKNLITKDHGKFIPVKENIDKIDITPKSNQITREFEHVIHSIQEFIKAKHNLEVEQNDIEGALICYLRKHDLDLLFAAERNSLLPKINPNKKLKFLINEFIGNAFRAEPQLFKFIVNLSIGHALSSTILFNDFNQYAGKFKKLSLFLDTPFIFNLLGINGIHKKSLAEELVSILKNEGVKIYILEITNKEVTSNLEEALKLLEKGKKDPTKGPLTFRACLDNGFNENDVEQMLLGLPEIFSKLGIGHDDVPSYDEFREFQIDEEKLYNTIIEAYGLDKPKPECNPEDDNSSDEKDEKEDKINNTIFRDVQVLSGVYRYRLGNNPKTLKDCKYLFITTNSSLAYASRKFERFENGKKYSLPTCLTDVFLGTLIWLHSPAQVETFSEKKIITDCYAALKPDEKIIAKYLDDVEKLKDKGEISQDNYILLRTHRAAINILENKTLGDINEFKPDTTEEILAELLKQIKSEEREKYLAEQSEHDKTQAELDAEKAKHINAIGLLEKKEQEDIQSQLERNKRIRISSEKRAKISIVIIQTLLVLLLLASTGVIIINNFTAVLVKSWLYILGWTIFTLTGHLNILTGFNVRQTRSLLHDKVADFYEKRIIKKIEKYG